MQTTDNKILTVSRILVRTLQKLKINAMFGYPGNTVLDVYDELALQNEINHYLMQSEQSAVHAAEGYARVSGNCAAAIVTAGPGALNTVTALSNAYLDGFPLVLIAGDISSDLAGKDAFQEINFPEIVKSCVKSVFKISDAEELESTLLQAYLVAMSGKKGPVVIDVPSDIFAQKTEYKDLVLPPDKVETVSDFDVSRAVEILKNAKSPVIICGGGVVHSKASAELEEAVRLLKIPVVTTMMGLGAFPASNPLNAGMIGVYGNKSANRLLKSADAIVVLGARFNDRVISASDLEQLNTKTIIQVDLNSKELIRNLSADLAVNADIKMFLAALCRKYTETGTEDCNYEYAENFRLLREDYAEIVSSKSVAQVLNSAAKGFVIATDVGQHQVSLVRNYGFEFAGQLLTSGGLGAMGFGFGAAIGASVALAKKPVILFTGDGSFQMCPAELAVCKRYGIPVKIFVMNNGELGLVRQLQDEKFEGRHTEVALCNPDFVKLAESFGVKAERVDSYSEIEPAIKRAIEENSPYLIDFVLEKGEMV